MISVSVVRRKYDLGCATNQAPICLSMEARFPRVVFAGNINFDDIAQAILSPRPSDYFLDSSVRGTSGMFWLNKGYLWNDTNEEVIAATLRDVMAFLEPRIIEEVKTQWLCNHPANRVLAARVMAGLLAGL